MSEMSEDQDHDVVFLHSPTEDGDGVRVVRARQGKMEVGEVRPVADGKPLRGEMIRLTPREGAPRVCDVKVEYAPTHDARGDDAKGPAQVATPRYRSNWDAIFGDGGAPPKKANALN